MKATRAAVAAVAFLGLATTGCLVQVTHVSDPGRAFESARGEALRDGARRVRASHLNVLAWDPGDREMVRVSVPLWLIRNVPGRPEAALEHLADLFRVLMRDNRELVPLADEWTRPWARVEDWLVRHALAPVARLVPRWAPWVEVWARKA